MAVFTDFGAYPASCVYGVYCFGISTAGRSDEERHHEVEQFVRPVERDEVAAVRDDLTDEVIGDGSELSLQCVADGVGADRQDGHGEPVGRRGLIELVGADRQAMAEIDHANTE